MPHPDVQPNRASLQLMVVPCTCWQPWHAHGAVGACLQPGACLTVNPAMRQPEQQPGRLHAADRWWQVRGRPGAMSHGTWMLTQGARFGSMHACLNDERQQVVAAYLWHQRVGTHPCLAACLAGMPARGLVAKPLCFLLAPPDGPANGTQPTGAPAAGVAALNTQTRPTPLISCLHTGSWRFTPYLRLNCQQAASCWSLAGS